MANGNNSETFNDDIEDLDNSPDEEKQQQGGKTVADEILDDVKPLAADDDISIEYEQPEAEDQGDEGEDPATGEEPIRQKTIRERIERANNDAATARGEAAEARITAFNERLQRIASQKVLGDSMVENLTNRRKEMQAQLKAAKEEGNTDLEVELIDQMQENATTLQRARDFKTKLDAEYEEANSKVGMNDRANAAAQRDRLTPDAQAWLQKQQNWWNDPEYEAEKAAVLLLDQRLSQRRADKGSAAYMQELDRLVASKFPSLPRQGRSSGGGADNRRPTTAGGRGTAARTGVSAPRSGATPGGNKGRVVITGADQRNMRQFGLDPMNKQHCIEWAKNRNS